MNVNVLVLGGRLTRDPETRYTTNGTAITKMGVAVNRRYKSKDGEWLEEPIFVDVTMFGKRGEAFAKYHTRGQECLFPEAELRFDQWTDKNTGEKRSKLYVVANGFEFVGERQSGTAQQVSEAGAADEPF